MLSCQINVYTLAIKNCYSQLFVVNHVHKPGICLQMPKLPGTQISLIIAPDSSVIQRF